jgi:hypothetical protein
MRDTWSRQHSACEAFWQRHACGAYCSQLAQCSASCSCPCVMAWVGVSLGVCLEDSSRCMELVAFVLGS